MNYLQSFTINYYLTVILAFVFLFFAFYFNRKKYLLWLAPVVFIIDFGAYVILTRLFSENVAHFLYAFFVLLILSFVVWFSFYRENSVKNLLSFVFMYLFFRFAYLSIFYSLFLSQLRFSINMVDRNVSMSLDEALYYMHLFSLAKSSSWEGLKHLLNNILSAIMYINLFFYVFCGFYRFHLRKVFIRGCCLMIGGVMYFVFSIIKLNFISEMILFILNISLFLWLIWMFYNRPISLKKAFKHFIKDLKNGAYRRF